MSIKEHEKTIEAVMDNLGKYFVADKELMEKIVCGFISGGHILFEDNPGLGKTLLVKLLARITGCKWKRIQFTPDLMPSDIVGTRVWKSSDSTFQLEKGPIFTNLLLADEINRAMPKTQSALLEAMEERQVTIEGDTHQLETPFITMATQNPIESEGTYPLPEAQLDRFTMKMSLGYVKSLEDECEIIRRRIEWGRDDPSIGAEPIMKQKDLVELQNFVEQIFVDQNIQEYIAKLVRGTRENPLVRIGSSPRGALAMLRLARSLAMIKGRDFVVPDDVKAISTSALSHRIILDIDYELDGGTPEEVIQEIVEQTVVPKEYKSRS